MAMRLERLVRQLNYAGLVSINPRKRNHLFNNEFILLLDTGHAVQLSVLPIQTNLDNLDNLDKHLYDGCNL